MPKGENQKLKLVRLIEIFMRRTDDECGITVNEIIEELARYGIPAERKSIYSDFAALEELGFPVIRLSGKPPAYTVGERIFELPELKMLVDAIQASKFITAERSRVLIEKLKLFAGSRGAKELSRQVIVEGRAKTENSAAVYTVDTIHKAINESRRISFSYFDYNSSGKRVFRHDGKIYNVSPKCLVWNDENYYLVGYDEDFGGIKNFRVDKMYKTVISNTEPSALSMAYKLNAADYSRKIFGMYGGREELVTLEAKERLAGVIIDRFGMDVTMLKTDFGFRAAIKVMVSPTFFSWIMSFGADMKIIEPAYVREELKGMLREIAENYGI